MYIIMFVDGRPVDFSRHMVAGGMEEAPQISAQRYREPPGGDLSDEELLVDVDDDNDDVFSEQQHVTNEIRNSKHILSHQPLPSSVKKGEPSTVKKVCLF